MFMPRLLTTLLYLFSNDVICEIVHFSAGESCTIGQDGHFCVDGSVCEDTECKLNGRELKNSFVLICLDLKKDNSTFDFQLVKMVAQQRLGVLAQPSVLLVGNARQLVSNF